MCDGKLDCKNGEDENGMCDNSCSSIDCQEDHQHCQRNPYSLGTCVCDEGYEMDKDGKNCVDTNECSKFPPVCQQVSDNFKKNIRSTLFHTVFLRNVTTLKEATFAHVSMDTFTKI